MTLTQKEKATRYDEALKEAVIAHKDEDKHLKATLERIFPELKVSEGEKIRKDLIEWIKEFPDTIWRGHNKKDVIAWLEKQAQKPANKVEPKFKIADIIKFKGIETLKGETETHKIVGYDNELYVFDDGTTDLFCEQDQYELVEQKPADNVESKFKVGNWYQCTKDFFGKGVTFDKNTAYYCAKEGCLQNEYGCHIAIVKDLYDNFKLWTIEDAADGEVLVSEYNQPFIYNGYFNSSNVGAYCGLNCMGEDFIISNELCEWTSNNNIKPADKDQRAKLETAITEAGYIWKAETKKLIEVSKQKEEMSVDEEKSWSEEDERILYETIQHLEELIRIDKSKYCDEQYYQRDIDWLKSLKDRVQPQSKQEYSADEDYIHVCRPE